jgi:hypothetical protein
MGMHRVPFLDHPRHLPSIPLFLLMMIFALLSARLFRSELYTHVRRTFFLYPSDYTNSMAFLSSPDDAFRSILSSVVNHVVIGRAAHLDVRLVIPLSIARARIKPELFGKNLSLSLSLSLSLMRMRHYPANGKDHRLLYKDDMLLEVVRTK